ncbi:MAG: CoA-binding protein [Deltaproteobacteria bacterium]|nr:CoA-binding protein [Deltaproteobacteria bacterium]
MENVVILGASTKEHRYSFKAQKMLMEHGHRVFPVSPNGKTILCVNGFCSICEIPNMIDTVTLYVGPQRQDGMIDEIIQKKPRRVIFNPGTEHPENMAKLKQHGIEVQEACTLVLLTTGQY